MKTRIGFTLVLCLVLFAFPASPQTKKIAFDGEAAYSYIKDLSADTMLGRKSGEPGGVWAAEYIAAKLKSWGLEPAGPNGGWFQDFTYEYYEAERGAAFQIVAHNAARDFVYGEDWRQFRYSGSGDVAADLVFLGYGISAPQKQYDEYANVDVKGKIVLFASETPPRFQNTLQEEATLDNRVKAARDHGAKGVLVFRSDASSGGYFRGSLTKANYQAGFPVLSIEPKVADFIFKWQKADPRYFFQQIEATGKPQSYEMGVQSLFHLRVVYDEKRPTQNVLAKLAGTDPKLKGETVIVGAHMDHLGVDMAGDVLNGADDNASGTAVVMEAARVLKLNGTKPRRTILFALWGAEEEGLLGSKYYTENPVYPLEKTIANINLDMEGHGTGKVRVGGYYFAPEVWDLLKARLPKDVLDNTVPGRGGPGGSDHSYFLYNGVPAFMVITDGSHFKTNRVGDVISLIKPEILRNSGLFVMASLDILTQEPNIPILPQRKETFYWRYQTVINHETPPLDEVIKEHGNVQDPDVDFQLALIAPESGLTGEAVRVDLMKKLWAGRDALAQTKGLAAFGTRPQAGGGMTGAAGASKTTVLSGIKGLGVLRDDPRWADVLAKQGLGFVLVDQPAELFDPAGLSAEGKKILEAAGKARLPLIFKGFAPDQVKALLENTSRPVFIQTTDVPDEAGLGLVKKTGSTLGLILGKNEAAAAYAGRILAARKALAPEFISIVTENCLWSAAGKQQMLGVIAELFKAKVESSDLAGMFSGAFQKLLSPVAF